MPFAFVGSALGISASAAAGLAGGALSIGGALISGNASDNAAQTEANAANQASQTELQMFNQTQANEKPYMAAGGNALTQLMKGLGIGGGNTTGTGSLNAPFTTADFTNTPGYQFQMQQGEQALLDQQSAVGGVGGGNTLKALTQYGQGVANQDYWNEYNAYVNRQNQQFGQLDTIAGSGQNAAANLGSIGTQVGQSVGQNTIGAGNATAAGQIASGNAMNSALSGAGNNFLLYSLLNGGGFGGSGGGFSSPTNPFSSS